MQQFVYIHSMVGENGEGSLFLFKSQMKCSMLWYVFTQRKSCVEGKCTVKPRLHLRAQTQVTFLPDFPPLSFLFYPLLLLPAGLDGCTTLRPIKAAPTHLYIIKGFSSAMFTTLYSISLYAQCFHR